MTTFDEVVPEVVEFLTKRHFHLEFRVSHAFFRHPAREEAEVSDYPSSDADSESGSIDSENQQFLMADDAVMANLAGHIRQGRSLAPELEIHLVRNKNTAYLHGWMYATVSISKLASVSKTWMQICWKQVTNKYNMSPTKLYDASVLWGLKTRTISNSEDELLAESAGIYAGAKRFILLLIVMLLKRQVLVTNGHSNEGLGKQELIQELLM